MKSFTKFISKNLFSFTGLIILLVLINVVIYGLAFGNMIFGNCEMSPGQMLEQTAEVSTKDGLPPDVVAELQEQGIWAMMLDADGRVLWSVDLPEEIPTSYSIGDVAVFSKGYLEDYPVFVWDTDNSLLVLGYPKDSYAKITSNYFAVSTVKRFPIFITATLLVDLFLVFVAYYFSKRRIVNSVEPIITSIKDLSDGNPVDLSVRGELAEVAEGINTVSHKLSQQNEARANWISGVSHDIRTPLSMIMGYADRIAKDETASDSVTEQAEIIRLQSVKIKELVQDLNLVSQLEYAMQPLQKSQVRISKLLRTYVAELLNSGVPEKYPIVIDISPGSEQFEFECDERLITRAVANLVQNSIKHNPQGCNINLELDSTDEVFSITVKDNGIGIAPEKLKELDLQRRSTESTDDSLNLKHGLGLILVRQIVEANQGVLKIEQGQESGLAMSMTFSFGTKPH